MSNEQQEFVNYLSQGCAEFLAEAPLIFGRESPSALKRPEPRLHSSERPTG